MVETARNFKFVVGRIGAPFGATRFGVDGSCFDKIEIPPKLALSSLRAVSKLLITFRNRVKG